MKKQLNIDKRSGGLTHQTFLNMPYKYVILLNAKVQLLDFSYGKWYNFDK